MAVAVSPAEVRHFAENRFRNELLDLINSELKANPGTVVSIGMAQIDEALWRSGKEEFLEEMESVLKLYRAVGWLVIRSFSGSPDQIEICWKFSAEGF